MIEVITNALITLFCLIMLGAYGVYLFTVCSNRYLNRNMYSRKEFIKDLIIPFRLWYITFCNLFEDFPDDRNDR